MKLFPYFAGQQTEKNLGRNTVLAPLPVKTRLKPAETDAVLTAKTESYIELGSYGGLILQTQMLLINFLVSFIAFLYIYTDLGGISGVVGRSYERVFINGQWVSELSYFLVFMGIGLLSLGPLSFGPAFLAMIHTHRDLARALPIRFHRQRREVMMSRWNKRKQQTEIKFFPWESVCAMAGEGTAVAPNMVMREGSLFIGAYDDVASGYFWASMRISALDRTHAAMKWEMIRSFMEEGPKAIGESQPVTMEGMVQQYCDEQGIKRKHFPDHIKNWWYLSGRMVAIWRMNWVIRKLQKKAEKFPQVAEWSKPLPKEEWAKPSEALNFFNHKLAENEYQRGKTILTVNDLRETYGPAWEESQQRRKEKKQAAESL
ncbi:hypothetical protein [Vibrio aerogenes]|nr:hypothetical protein [Vibrio aerogenes]